MGKQIYLTDDQLKFLAAITDSCNAVEDDERDEIRNQIQDKIINALGRD